MRSLGWTALLCVLEKMGMKEGKNHSAMYVFMWLVYTARGQSASEF